MREVQDIPLKKLDSAERIKDMECDMKSSHIHDQDLRTEGDDVIEAC
jgi:hypothetical protein